MTEESTAEFMVKAFAAGWLTTIAVAGIALNACKPAVPTPVEDRADSVPHLQIPAAPQRSILAEQAP